MLTYCMGNKRDDRVNDMTEYIAKMIGDYIEFESDKMRRKKGSKERPLKFNGFTQLAVQIVDVYLKHRGSDVWNAVIDDDRQTVERITRDAMALVAIVMRGAK